MQAMPQRQAARTTYAEAPEAAHHPSLLEEMLEAAAASPEARLLEATLEATSAALGAKVTAKVNDAAQARLLAAWEAQQQAEVAYWQSYWAAKAALPREQPKPKRGPCPNCGRYHGAYTEN